MIPQLATIESDRIGLGVDQSRIGASEDAVRPGVVHVPGELFTDDAHDRRLRSIGDVIDPF